MIPTPPFSLYSKKKTKLSMPKHLRTYSIIRIVVWWMMSSTSRCLVIPTVPRRKNLPVITSKRVEKRRTWPLLPSKSLLLLSRLIINTSHLVNLNLRLLNRVLLNRTPLNLHKDFMTQIPPYSVKRTFMIQTLLFFPY